MAHICKHLFSVLLTCFSIIAAIEAILFNFTARLALYFAITYRLCLQLEREEHANGASHSHSHDEHAHEHAHAEHSSSADHSHSHEHGHEHHDHDHEHGHSHTHDDSVSSVSIVLDGNIDPDKLDGWLEELLIQNAETLYRYKGIMSVEGNNARSVFQV